MAFAVPLLLALTADPAPVVERGVAPAAAATFFSTSVWLGLVAGQRAHAPKACRLCASNPLDEGTRSALRWSEPRLPDTLSNVGLALTPAWVLGSLVAAGAADHRTSATIGADVLLVAESTSLAMMLNQLVKMEAARQRPYAHHGLMAAPGTEDNLSFFSGHTTWGFSSAVAAGTVASLRGYRGAPAVWAGGLAFAATTGYLRIAADKHWLTDVLTGAAVGAAIGALVPRLHLAPADPGTSAAKAPASAPAWITVGGTF